MAARLSLHRLEAAGTSTSRPHILPIQHALFYGLLALTTLSPLVSALQHVAGGQCESACSDASVGTLHQDVVCLDGEFDSTPGSYFKQCVSCQLNSTSVDPATNLSDVDWALCKNQDGEPRKFTDLFQSTFAIHCRTVCSRTLKNECRFRVLVKSPVRHCKQRSSTVYKILPTLRIIRPILASVRLANSTTRRSTTARSATASSHNNCFSGIVCPTHF